VSTGYTSSSSTRTEMIRRTAYGKWRPSRYGHGLVLTDRREDEDGCLGTEPEGKPNKYGWASGKVFEYVDRGRVRQPRNVLRHHGEARLPVDRYLRFRVGEADARLPGPPGRAIAA